MEHIDTLEFHKNNPDVSVETYIKRKNIELSYEIRIAKKIYLDTKYWILLRDARTRKDINVNTLQLLNLLENFVKDGKAICPISTDIFWEIRKQTDIKTLEATVQIIDDLSKGVTILSLPERLNLEFMHFVRTKFKQHVYSPDEMIWTKIPYILGFANPVSKTLPTDILLALQKAFIDQLWVVSLKDFLGPIEQITIPPPCYIDLSKTLNQKKIEHINDYKSFKQLFLTELRGILDGYREHSEDLMIHLFESGMGHKFPKEEITVELFGKYFIGTIYQNFVLNKMDLELPSFQVMAKLHAATRWDEYRKIKPNDIYDIHHAIDAIPYYDYFLTEHSLRNLVNNKNLDFEVFRCKTISDIDTAISELLQIAPK
jgi:hypothetical protein